MKFSKYQHQIIRFYASSVPHCAACLIEAYEEHGAPMLEGLLLNQAVLANEYLLDALLRCCQIQGHRGMCECCDMPTTYEDALYQALYELEQEAA